jgi:hypothetical protein
MGGRVKSALTFIPSP